MKAEVPLIKFDTITFTTSGVYDGFVQEESSELPTAECSFPLNVIQTYFLPINH